MTSDLDPRAAQALTTISNVRRLLDAYERVLRIPRLQNIVGIDSAVRALNFSHHTLAVSWNSSLASVNVPLDERPPQPSVQPQATSSSREWRYGRHEMT